MPILVEKIYQKLDKGGVVGAVFLDLKKAFDTVKHRILLNKLSQFNFSVRAVQWMESYLTPRKQCVKVQNSTSATCYDEVSALCPLLFSLYINYIPNSCPSNVLCQMFADVALSYVHVKNKLQAAKELSSATLYDHKYCVSH